KQILTFSRKSDEKLLPLRVSPIIKEVLKLLRATLPSTIKISENIDSNSDTVLADPTQIHQILMNLCTNAACAIPQKKGEIKISLASEQIESDISSGLDSGMYLKLAVSDTGIGMDSGTMGRIFDPFFTTKKPGEGTGLGLSVVYGIVKSYGGTITVQSEAGKGSEFCVYLPLFTKAENNEEKPKEAAAGGKERILFVDDEEPLVELGENLLASLGYDVVGKKNSLEALDLFSSCPEKFDLVVTDLTMPDMTGIDLAQKILRIKPGMPIILCTGFSESITPESIDSVGVKDLIMKPFQRRQIAESIRKTLDKKE
ncbi:MAG: ATP-binding protein, partial [Smithellaceae bacterium]